MEFQKMVRWINLFNQKKNKWMILFSSCLLFLGATMTVFAATNLIRQQLTYNSYKQNQSASFVPNELTKKEKKYTTKRQLSTLTAFTSAVSYPNAPKLGDSLGKLLIPKLKVDLPIIEGASPAQLAKGIGHFHRSVLPGKDNNCILSGHRDTVFRHLGQLKMGDELIVKTAAGYFVYTIKKIRIVDQSDHTVIVPTRLPTLTLTTCYPFHFIGNAPKRYIIVAHLQPSKSQVN